MAADESCHTRTSSRGCDVPRDQSPPHNPSTPILARDETEPTNQCSSEAGAEPRESGPATVMEANSIQLQSAGATSTRDGIEADSTVCQLDKALSRPVSPVMQHQRKQAGSRSGGEYSPRDLSRSCSVSVAVSEPQFHWPEIKSSTRAGHARCTGKRKTRTKSLCDVDSDDPNDCDYTDENDSGVGDISALPRPAKKQRRAAAMKVQPTRVRHRSPHSVSSPPAQSEEVFANPPPAPSLQDIETIPVRGFLTRQTFLSSVVYSCTFEEDRQPSCPHGPAKPPAYSENLDQIGRTKQLSSKKPTAHATRFLPDEDELLVDLKERRCLPWSRIAKHFPGRTKGSLQVRYSTRLKNRGTGSLGREVGCAVAAAAVPRDTCIDTRLRRASSRSIDSDPLTRQRYGPPRARRLVNRYSPV